MLWSITVSVYRAVSYAIYFDIFVYSKIGIDANVM